MRHIDRLPAPDILVQKHIEWQQKYEEKLAENPSARPDSPRYAHKQIKDRLFEMSFGKCFYCETKLTDSNKEVDHFVEVAIDHSKAYEWENLYLACSNCNDKVNHLVIPVTDALDPCRDSDAEIQRNISFEAEQPVGGCATFQFVIQKLENQRSPHDAKIEQAILAILDVFLYRTPQCNSLYV